VGVPLVQRNRHQKENRNFSTKSTKEENILLKFAPSPYPIFVLLCLKIFSICANHAAKAVSFSVLALRAANNAVMTLRPFSVTT
jgi:hypothetical protein